MNLAAEIRQWRADIASMNTAPTSYTIAILCYFYNWATSPNTPRTEREHRACRKVARWCQHKLKYRGFWCESDGGWLYTHKETKQCPRHAYI